MSSEEDAEKYGETSKTYLSKGRNTRVNLKLFQNLPKFKSKSSQIFEFLTLKSCPTKCSAPCSLKNCTQIRSIEKKNNPRLDEDVSGNI